MKRRKVREGQKNEIRVLLTPVLRDVAAFLDHWSLRAFASIFARATSFGALVHLVVLEQTCFLDQHWEELNKDKIGHIRRLVVRRPIPRLPPNLTDLSCHGTFPSPECLPPSLSSLTIWFDASQAPAFSLLLNDSLRRLNLWCSGFFGTIQPCSPHLAGSCERAAFSVHSRLANFFAHPGTDQLF